MNILLVEDGRCLSRQVLTVLEHLGILTLLTPNVDFSLLETASQPFEILVLVLNESDSVGLQLFCSLRARFERLPIVVLTYCEGDAAAVEFLRLGAQDWLTITDICDRQLRRCFEYAIERNALDRKRCAAAERMKLILANAHDAFISVDANWHISDWSKEAEKMFGWKKDEALGQQLSMLLPIHFRRQYMKAIQFHFSNYDGEMLRTSRQIVAVHHDSKEFPVELNILSIAEEPGYKIFVRNMADLHKSKIELERLVQERTEKLTRSNEELNQFAKVASHDLQEPLRAVQGFANLLSESTKGKLESNCEEFIAYILDGVQRMQHLIRSVLIHSQIENDDSLEHVTNCNQAVDEVLVDLRDTIEQTETLVEVDRLPSVAVARSQVIQLFQNLISNSIKYRSSKTPHLLISAQRNAHHWLFSLRDNGIGIESKYSDSIFNMFSRLHAKTKYPGTGMGLAICKRIVTSHGGTIWVESTPGEGSLFLFTLPMVEVSRSKHMKKQIDILLAEDTPSDIRLTEEALSRSDLDYTLTVVNDGVEALEHLYKLKAATSRLPDILLLDLNMPRKNGHEVLNEVKNDLALRHIPVVLLTVSERDEDVLEALRQRMNYYLAKPVTSDKLTVLIRSIHELQTQPSDKLAVHTDEEVHVRLVLAGNPHTSVVALAKLAQDPNERIRSRVAENPNVGAAIIETLAHDPSVEVRVGVCENPSTPLAVLAGLANDPSDDVRLGMSSNPRTPPEILMQLTADDNMYVASAARNTLAGTRYAQDL